MSPQKYLDKCIRSLIRAELVASIPFAGERQFYLVEKAQKRVARAADALRKEGQEPVTLPTSISGTSNGK